MRDRGYTYIEGAALVLAVLIVAAGATAFIGMFV